MIDSQIDPIAMCIKNLNNSSSLYVEERLAENKILDFNGVDDIDPKTKVIVMEVQAEIKLKAAMDAKKREDQAKLKANQTYMMRHNEFKNHNDKQKRKTIMALTKQEISKSEEEDKKDQ